MTLEQAGRISVGDLIDINGGPLSGCNAIVEKVTMTENTFSPIARHYGGPAILFKTDIGSVHHFFVECIRSKGWISA